MCFFSTPWHTLPFPVYIRYQFNDCCLKEHDAVWSWNTSSTAEISIRSVEMRHKYPPACSAHSKNQKSGRIQGSLGKSVTVVMLLISRLIIPISFLENNCPDQSLRWDQANQEDTTNILTVCPFFFSSFSFFLFFFLFFFLTPLLFPE